MRRLKWVSGADNSGERRIVGGRPEVSTLGHARQSVVVVMKLTPFQSWTIQSPAVAARFRPRQQPSRESLTPDKNRVEAKTSDIDA